MKLIIIFSILFFTLESLGQNRIPFDGENIIFYPLNEDNVISKEGYDCFYSAEQVVQKGKYKFSPKYRFNRNDKNVTAPNEIEEYTFNVLSHEILNNKTEEQTLLLFLRRNEDYKNVIMRIPWYTDEKSNSITRSFLKYRYGEDKLGKYTKFVYINLPFVNIDSLSSIRRNFVDSLIVAENDYPKELSDRVNDFNTILKSINKTDVLKSHEVYTCGDIEFLKLYSTDIYKQLCANVTKKTGEKIIIPISYFAGNTKLYDSNNGTSFYFPSIIFQTRNNYLNKTFKKWKCTHIVEKYKGKSVYYGLKQHYVSNTSYYENDSENRIIDNKLLYRVEEGPYECIAFDVLEQYCDKKFIPFAILKDSKGIIFKVPVCKTLIIPYKKNYCESFDKYFALKEEVEQIKHNRLIIRQEQESIKNEKLHKLTVKYGKIYADYLIDKEYKVIERFDQLAKKYGKQNAKLMIEGTVRIGWSKVMCKESWGKPDKVNTTTASWGVEEQWVYESATDYSYDIYCLYFRNGILTTIQD